MNSVNLIGRLGRDPELKQTNSGKSVCEINVAVDDGYGENKKTAWIGVVLWNKAAELVAQHFHKGDQIGITGRLSQDEWQDKETGKTQRKTKIVSDSFFFCGGKREAANDTPHQRSQSMSRHEESKVNAYQPDNSAVEGDGEEDILFAPARSPFPFA